MSIRIRLTLLSFLQFAVWGAYLTSMGTYLFSVGLADQVSYFYAVQGIVSLFMPTLIGIIADRWIPAQKMLGICHLVAAAFMGAAAYYALGAGSSPQFNVLFGLYTISVSFYMPTLALSNSVAYSVLGQAKLDPVKAFPPIRVFGTIGFICAMVATNFIRIEGMSIQNLPHQFFFSGLLALVLGVYAFTLPGIPVNIAQDKNPLTAALGFNAFKLFKDRKMAVFFIFSMLLGVSLQITNGFAGPFITTFKDTHIFANTWVAHNPNAIISISQMSEALCILLIPFCLRKWGIKKVMLISMFAWVLRFALFGAGDPGSGVWMLILSMVIYGIAFDFFNVSGSLFVNTQTDPQVRSSAQGLFVMMTNGFGASIGMLAAGWVVKRFVNTQTTVLDKLAGWDTAWYIFAAYALVVAVVFAFVFKYKHTKS